MEAKLLPVIEKNNLFPVFFKLEQLRLLIVGGGNIGLEKLQTVMNNSPQTSVKLIAKEIQPEIYETAKLFPNIQLNQKAFENSDLDEVDLVILATNDNELNAEIRLEARKRKLLLNVADKPELCDFYLGSVVQKGDLKIAISTNGKSPTIAKRIKETLNEVFPEQIHEVLENLYKIRSTLNGNFKSKVERLNAITSILAGQESKKVVAKRTKTAIGYSLLVIFSMVIGHLLFTYIPVNNLAAEFVNSLDNQFWLFVLGGFIAQMIDGSLGMAYGVSVTTFLLSMGIPAITPAVASASMHASEVFTTGSSSLVYMRHKNVNWQLFKKLLIPGALGAILGALAISYVSKESISVIRPLVAVYTMVLGIIIILRVFQINLIKKSSIKNMFPVAILGGFLDSVGGGGWGPIVTSSLLAKGHHLRFAVGSSHLAKFFVALISTFTFFTIIGLQHWQIIFGLVIGGMVAAPISIYISTKVPIRQGLLLVGTLVIIISLRIIVKAFL